MGLFNGNKNNEDVLNKMTAADFSEGEIAGKNKELYYQYQNYFQELKSEIDEINMVAEQFDGMSEGVTESSNHVKHAVQFLADGSAQQARDISRCKDVTAQLSGRISIMDDKTKEMLDQVQSMEHQSNVGRENVLNLSNAQESLSQALQTISEGIYDVIDKNEKIVAITDMLYGIAKQTNLLSLNASIEAARAGEAGRGFSYVAFEVRKLSEECHSASENINSAVKDIVKALSSLEDIMKHSQEAFEKQRLAANEVVNSFEKINESVKEFANVQNSFTEQFDSVNSDKEDLIEIMDSIAHVVVQASASAENVAELAIQQAEAANDMNKVSARLKSGIGKMERTTGSIKTMDSGRRRKKVAMIWDLDDPFWYPATKEAHRTAKILNFDIYVDAPKGRGEEGTLEMVRMLEKVRDEKFDGICISPISDKRVEKLLQEISKNGTKIIFILSVMENVPHEALIGTNSYNCGRSTGNAIKDIMGGQGDVAIIKWKDNLIETVEERYQGAVDVLNATNITLHNILGPGEPSAQEAAECIEPVLKAHPEISMFCATNVGWGLAFARYLKQKHSDIRLVTVDFTDDVSAFMREGYIDAAIAQKPELWGSMTLKKMQDVFEGKKIEKVIDTGTYEVNIGNLNIYS